MTSYTYPMARKKSLGEQLADSRRAYGMSQDELGEAIGAAGRTVSTWETGVHLPTRRVQSTLEALYGWPAGTIGYSIRTGTALPAVVAAFTPRPSPAAEAEGRPPHPATVESIERLDGEIERVNDALQQVTDQLHDLQARVKRLESRGQRSTRAR